MELSKGIFWDVDPITIDYDKHARFVIERVVTRGQLSDFRKILAYYGKPRMAKEAVQIRSLDKKSLHFLSSFLSIPIQQFRCYTQTQSNQAHWNY